MAWLLLLLGAVLFLTYQGEVDACSCQPMHPQDLYCRSDFVIKVLVNKGRLVELGPDGRYKRVHKHLEEKETDETESSGVPEEVEEGPEIEGAQILKEVEIVRPAPIQARPRGPVGPDSRMPGYNPGPAGLFQRTRKVVHPPGYSSNGDARLKRSALRSSAIHRRASFNVPSLIAPGNFPEDHGFFAAPQKTLMTQYRINMIKIFKGLKNFTKSQLDFVYTPPAPLCNVELETTRSPFILMGDVQGGVLVIKACGYKVNLLKLSQDERSNVVRNMEHRYPNECGRCRVRMCNRGGCDEGNEQPFTCVWKEWWNANSPWSSQFACIHAKNGKCKWYCPLPQDVKPEDIDKWIR